MRETNRRLTVVALMLAMFLSAMEATAVSTAMPTVIGDLGGVEYYAWIFTVYMLTSTISVPIWGKLTDLFGRKPVMLWGLALFLLFDTVSSRRGGADRRIVVNDATVANIVQLYERVRKRPPTSIELQGLIDSHVRERMQTVLDDIRSGEFAKLWIAEMESGEAGLKGHRAEAANQLIEQVGEELRGLMRREDTSAVG